VSRVLLVDDHPAMRDGFKAAFPAGEADAYGTLADVRAAGPPSRWSAVFVDFDLSSTTETGLSVLAYFTAASPQTRLVVYTMLSENGRALFALAAHQWFHVQVVLDKASGDRITMGKAADPGEDNPTAPGWKKHLHQHADLVDDLLPNAGWIPFWRAWPELNGSLELARKKFSEPGQPEALRKFSVQAGEAVRRFHSAFGGPAAAAMRANTARATPVASFALAHDHFFGAPDLEAVYHELDSAG